MWYEFVDTFGNEEICSLAGWDLLLHLCYTLYSHYMDKVSFLGNPV